MTTKIPARPALPNPRHFECMKRCQNRQSHPCSGECTRSREDALDAGLRRCPFCDGTPVLRESKGRRMPWHVECFHCGASSAKSRSADLAAQLWNRRNQKHLEAIHKVVSDPVEQIGNPETLCLALLKITSAALGKGGQS